MDFFDLEPYNNSGFPFIQALGCIFLIVVLALVVSAYLKTEVIDIVTAASMALLMFCGILAYTQNVYKLNQYKIVEETNKMALQDYAMESYGLDLNVDVTANPITSNDENCVTSYSSYINGKSFTLEDSTTVATASSVETGEGYSFVADKTGVVALLKYNEPVKVKKLESTEDSKSTEDGGKR